MARYRVSRKALNDLDSIWLFIAQDNETAADRLMDRMSSAFEALASQPQIGRARPEIGPKMRSIAVGEIVLFYEIVPPGVRIVRVWDGRRDLAKLRP
jgi:toxin ParE1/3/4